jgi:hypothetical protein
MALTGGLSHNWQLFGQPRNRALQAPHCLALLNPAPDKLAKCCSAAKL